MNDDATVDTLALIPCQMQALMEELQGATAGNLRRCATVADFVDDSTERAYGVALIPVSGFSTQEWWTIWGFLNTMDPRPSILVYTIRSDFEMWSSVLDSGGFDVIVAPFTAEKLRRAIASAYAEFVERRGEERVSRR
jgi:FixJ family two-component response regulator